MKVMGFGLLLVALWGAAPTRAFAQQVSPPQLELLRENREMLQLTEEQVTRLEAIRASLMQRNEPLIARIVELRRDFQQEQRAVRAQGRRQGQPLRQTPLLGGQTQPTARLEEIRTSVQAILDQIQANNRGSMVEVNQLLTRPQRARLRELLQSRRPAPAPGGAARRGGAGGPGAPAALGG